MNLPDDHRADGSESARRQPWDGTTDDTIETSLADDLLASDESSADGIQSDETQVLGDSPVAPVVAAADDEDDYLAPEGRRSRWTIGLAVALIFAVGMLAGVVLAKTLSPSPPAQVVYLLNDAGGASANPFPPGGMPTGGPPDGMPSGGPPSAPTSTETPR